MKNKLPIPSDPRPPLDPFRSSISALHVAGELFKFMAGVDMIHVPYRGEAPALTDLIANQVHVCVSGCFGAAGTASSSRAKASHFRTLALQEKI